MTGRAVAATAALCVLCLAAPAARQTFRARRDVVRVDALVTDHGKFVAGLKPSDFEVRDNGVVQDVDLALVDDQPVNAILALDLSESVAGDRLTQLRDANRDLVGALRKDDRAALIGFSHAVRLRAPLGTDRSGLLGALAEPGGEGGTALYDASYASLELAETDRGRSLIIVFSDGVDTASWLTKDAVHDAAQRSDTVVYGVSVAGSRPTFLRDLTAETGGAVFEVESTKNLGTMFVRVLDDFRHRYLLSYSPKDVRTDGFHHLDVRVKGRGGLTVKARPGYLAGSPGN